MNIQELAEEYRGKSDEELLRLTLDLEHLTAEAQLALSTEMTKRQIYKNMSAVTNKSEEQPRGESATSVNLPGTEPRTSFGWQALWFVAHLVFVYLLVTLAMPRIAYWVRNTIVPVLRPENTSSRFEFLFTHLFSFSFIPGFVCGFINARFKHKAAKFVWLVPTAILAYKLMTFSASTSVLQSHSLSAFHQYFGGGFLVPDFRDWSEFWTIVVPTPDYRRGMTQVGFTAPFYAAVAYSFSAWFASRTRLNETVARLFARNPAPRGAGD